MAAGVGDGRGAAEQRQAGGEAGEEGARHRGRPGRRARRRGRRRVSGSSWRGRFGGRAEDSLVDCGQVRGVERELEQREEGDEDLYQGPLVLGGLTAWD